MGNRLSKLTTRTGDDGTTGLADGSRIKKTASRIRAIGDVDELNSCLGIVLAGDSPENIRDDLLAVQHALFDIGGELSMPGHHFIDEKDIEFLEKRLEDYNRDLPPLKEFILPGGTPSAANAHLARSVCRRTERQLSGLNEEEGNVNTLAIIYLNRLSDLLFVVARVLSRQQGGQEVHWEKDRRR